MDHHLNNTLMIAVLDNKRDDVARLAPLCDLNNPGCQALYFASTAGHAELVSLLIPYSDKNKNTEALLNACLKSHIDCVRLLAPVSDVTVRNSLPLQYAVCKKDHAMIDVLYPLSEPHKALAQLKKESNNPAQWGILQDMIEAERQKNVLLQEAYHAGDPSKPRKM